MHSTTRRGFLRLLGLAALSLTALGTGCDREAPMREPATPGRGEADTGESGVPAAPESAPGAQVDPGGRQAPGVERHDAERSGAPAAQDR